jgi:anti-sigma factor RsiW
MMFSCRQMTELVTDYFEDQLSFWERLRFQMHLGMCMHCRTYLKQMKTVYQSLGHLPAEEIPADAEEALMARFRGWSQGDEADRGDDTQ